MEWELSNIISSLVDGTKAFKNKLVDNDGNDLGVAGNALQINNAGSDFALQEEPLTGTKTVTSTAAEVFAGSSRKTGRSMLYIRNTHDSLAIRIGGSDVTDVKGRRILPQSEEKIEIDPLSDVPLYAISEYGDVKVEVFEA